MKKSLFLLPLAALVLNACSSDSTSATVENAAGTATSTAYDMQTEVQSAAMPSSMTSTAYTQPTSYTQPQPMAYSQPQPVSNYSQSASSSGEFYIPRDSEGKPIYSQITKGSYTGSSYTVQKGDTMYLVGYISGKGASGVASLNGLSTTTPLKVGQVLRLQ